MPELFVHKVIDINAPASRVWEVLTLPEFTRQWSGPFGAAGPIDSDWRPGSEVLWRNPQGRVYVSGRVIAAEPNRRLQFSVRAIEPDRQPTSKSEGGDITQTYLLSGEDAQTSLSIDHGNFAKIPNGRDIVPLAASIWDTVLQKIKELAEQGTAEGSRPAPPH